MQSGFIAQLLTKSAALPNGKPDAPETPADENPAQKVEPGSDSGERSRTAAKQEVRGALTPGRCFSPDCDGLLSVSGLRRVCGKCGAERIGFAAEPVHRQAVMPPAPVVAVTYYTGERIQIPQEVTPEGWEPPF